MRQLEVKGATLDLDSMSQEERNRVQKEIEVILMHSLATYVLVRRKDPLCDLLEDLLALEVEAGAKLKKALFDRNLDLKGALAGILSVIPISTQGRRIAENLNSQRKERTSKN